MSRPRVPRAFALLLALAAVALGAASEASAAPYIQAHRGGPVVNGEPTFPEATMPAFRYSAREGFILEFDVKLTQDGVPVVFHDSELDRATDCEGLIAETTLAQLADCRVDILGTEAAFEQLELKLVTNITNNTPDKHKNLSTSYHLSVFDKYKYLLERIAII